MEKPDYLSKLSLRYFKALADATTFHATTDKFSGKFIRPHARHIKDLIEQYNIETVLDYGCGKGLQYTWIMPDGQTLEQYWGVEVTKFDPAVPKFNKEPEGPHDLVIVSHVLGTIPPEDQSTIVERIFNLTKKYVYVLESIGRPKKIWTNQELEVFNTMDWIDLLAPLKPPSIKCELVVRYRSQHGSHTGRFML